MKCIFSVDILKGTKVLFFDSKGLKSFQEVTWVWERDDGVIPLVNLGRDCTSIPHISQVPGATGVYYQVLV